MSDNIEVLAGALSALREDLFERYNKKLIGSKNVFGEIVHDSDKQELQHMKRLIERADRALRATKRNH